MTRMALMIPAIFVTILIIIKTMTLTYLVNYTCIIAMIIISSLKPDYCQTFHNLKSNPVDTRRRFNANTTSYDVVRRRIDVETTSYVYREININALKPFNLTFKIMKTFQ